MNAPLDVDWYDLFHIRMTQRDAALGQVGSIVLYTAKAFPVEPIHDIAHDLADVIQNRVVLPVFVVQDFEYSQKIVTGFRPGIKDALVFVVDLYICQFIGIALDIRDQPVLVMVLLVIMVGMLFCKESPGCGIGLPREYSHPRFYFED